MCERKKLEAAKPPLEEIITQKLSGNSRTKEIIDALKKDGVKHIGTWYMGILKHHTTIRGKLVFEDGHEAYNVATSPYALDLSVNVPNKGYVVLNHVGFLSLEHARGNQHYYFMVRGKDSMTVKAVQSQSEITSLKPFKTALCNYVLFPLEFDLE